MLHKQPGWLQHNREKDCAAGFHVLQASQPANAPQAAKMAAAQQLGRNVCGTTRSQHKEKDMRESRPVLLITDASLEAANRVWAPLRSRGELPHLYKPGGTYFVTFCLRDAAIQQKKAGQDREDVGGERTEGRTIRYGDTDTPTGEKPEAIAAASEPPIAAGSCILRQDRPARIMANTLRHFDGQRYALHAWCVMPNHVHVVVTPIGEWSLSQITHSWKSYTANEINRLLGRKGVLWARECFDHLIRSFSSFRKFVEYTVQNPVAAGLCAQPEDWPFSSVSRVEADS